MYFDILALVAVISLSLILAFYNHRQAKALRGVERMVKDFLAIQIRDRREKRKADLSVNATEWLTRLINARVEQIFELQDIIRIVPEVFAAEIRTASGQKIVVSTKPKTVLKQHDKNNQARGKKNSAVERISAIASAPLLGRKFITLEINMIEETEWFDLEAEQVGQALGVGWGQPVRLWIYITG
jgi:hypothetical protein